MYRTQLLIPQASSAITRTSILSVWLFILFSFTATAWAATAAPSAVKPASVRVIPAPPAIAAKGYLLLDAATGSVILEQNADAILPPASLTKMMTAYIVAEELQRGKLKETDEVTISEEAWRKGGSKSGGSTMFLPVGSKASVIDLLKGVIIQSGNDASIALAEHLAGSETAFADSMNQYAEILGMPATHYRNATGLPEDEHVTTARDLATLARAIIYNHPDRYGIYAEKSFTFNGITQSNRNLLLYRDSSVDGLKTGHTEAAGYCLVASAKRQDMRLISVVMGTVSEKSRAEESQKLLAFGFRYYGVKTLFNKNQEISQTRVWKGKSKQVSLGVAEDAKVTIQKGMDDLLTTAITLQQPIQAPIEQGQVLGELHVTLENKEIFKAPIVALQAVEKANIFARIWDAIVLFLTGMFGS